MQIKNNKFVVRIIENIKYYFNLYNYAEFIKIEGLNYILNHINKNGYNKLDNSVVDLGGGNGLFAYRLKKRGLKNKITVVDNYMDQQFGFMHIKKNIEEFNGVKYKIVLCLLVLELVDDRGKILNTIKNILESDGICFIIIPNIKGVNVQIWREKAKKNNSELSQLFYRKQKLVSIAVIEEELRSVNMKILEVYNFGFLPTYATNSKKRFTKQCYLELNINLKNYLESSYNLLVVKKDSKNEA